MTEIASPETKAVTRDLDRAFDEFRRGFEAYKAENEERMSQMEKRGSADVVTTEKSARIEDFLDRQQKRIDEMLLKQARPRFGADNRSAENHLDREHKQAFETYVRAGEFSGLKAIEQKALSAGSGPDGGYLAPANVEDEVMRRLSMLSPIRGIASVRSVSVGTYKKAFSTAGAASGWVAETAARPQTNTPTLAEMSFPTMELYAMPAATQTILDDAALNIDSWLADEVETAFAEQESAALVNGSGTSQPKGFLNYTKVANGSWSWGNIGYLATGVAGGFSATNPSDQLVDLIYALKGPFRQNGSFVMNRKTQAAVRKFKASTGEYLWTPPAAVGQPALLMGFPVVEVEEMPDIATASYSVAFGDFRRGYLIVDRIGLRILRDPYSAKPYVLFYTTKRVGGGVQDFDAIKLLKFDVS
ncbi:phage major capsid protein [Terrarubrum flagellatum]|uniref:phage major capsid protein n=1 Tax=Terrirubrum flagellatum TaxID=2895980 RepID=UPI003144E979